MNAYFKALDEAVKIVNEVGSPINVDNDDEMRKIVQSCIGTKFVSKWGNLITDLAIKSTKIVIKREGDIIDIDTKRYAKVEKIPGGLLEESVVLDGVMFNKDITHPGMRRKIVNPRVVLLDCPLEYKKGESALNMEMTNENDFKQALLMEEEEVKKMCDEILRVKPDVVITEKGVSDSAQHFLMKKGNCSVIRRARKTDNNRIARISGATIANRPEELTEADVGELCGLFEIRKIGDEYFTFMVDCKNPTACTILLRGASKDVLNEIERNLQDAIGVTRNVFLNPKLVPGGGAIEMELAYRLTEYSKTIEGV